MVRTRLIAALALIGMASFAACGGGGSGASSTGGTVNPPIITPTPFPSTTISPGSSTLVCRSAGTPQSVSRTADVSLPKRPPETRGGGIQYVPGIIEVSYRSADLLAHRTQAERDIAGAGG